MGFKKRLHSSYCLWILFTIRNPREIFEFSSRQITKLSSSGAGTVIVASGSVSGATAGDSKITGLTNGKTYKVEAYTSPANTTTETTSTGTVVDEKTGEVVEAVETKVTTESDGTKTVAVKSQEAILIKQPNGTNSTLSDISKLAFSVPVTTGTNSNNAQASVSIASDGTISAKGLANNTESKFDITFDLGNGQKITIGTIDVKKYRML